MFWTLALLRVFELPELPLVLPSVNRVFFLLKIFCIVGILFFSGARAPWRLGMPAALFMASSATHLIIGGGLALLQFSPLKLNALQSTIREHVAADMAFVALVLGARVVIDKWGVDKTLRALLLVLVLACVVVIGLPFWLWAGFPQIPGSFFHPTRYFGTFTTPMSAAFAAGSTVAIGMTMLDQRRVARISAFALTVGPLSAVAPLSKSGVVGFLAVVAFFLIVGGRVRRRRILAWMGIAAIAGIMVFVSLDYDFLETSQVIRIAETIQLLSGNTDTDVLSWRGHMFGLAWDEYVKSPMLGLGYGEMLSLDRAPIGGIHTLHQLGAHNHYLTLGAEAGIVPVLFFSMALFSLLRPLWTLPNSWATYAGASVGILLFLLSLAESRVNFWSSSMFIVAVCCALVADAADKHRRSLESKTIARPRG